MAAMTENMEWWSSEDRQPVRPAAETRDAREAVVSGSGGADGQEAKTGPNWANLVARVQRGEGAGMEELYLIFARGIRYYLCRQLGPQELDDKVHDAFLIVVQAIQRGDLREPDRLMGFVRTIVRRQVAAYIDHVVHTRKEELDIELGSRIADHRCNPEQTVAMRQKADLMQGILRRLSERDREILTRFYLDEQTEEQICKEMNLSETQFRLLKSRAKSRFGEMGKKKLQRPLLSFFVRSSMSQSH